MSRYEHHFAPQADNARDFRNALGLFPTGVVIVTAEVAGERIGMTMSSFNSLSLDPALVLFSIGRSARSLPAWERAGGYAIHILSADQSGLSNRFARPSDDKFAGLETARGETGAPLIDGARAVFECRPHAIHDAGDHRLFIAEVTSVHVATDRHPLVFSQGRYASLN
ncbi:flavin reductase family protein [Paenirhodobacter populi]|uniref:Flavin reductase n=1 Tax=Paenirhodobacter populi TaxID=2306993 RepID=A0A443JGH9_9RHOB|nr:flavin reductase family protein [Sinirhodobacter populi]RWR19590.1 flavin reductase [Sinirhodobacter populi]